MERSEEHSRPAAYSLAPGRLLSEDVAICVDVDVESTVEVKVPGPKGRPLTRLDCIRQAILLFVSAKLTINPDHRFSFSTLTESASPLQEFSNQVESLIEAVRTIKATESSSGVADLTQLFRMASLEAKKSRAQNRIFRVVLIYCRSSTRPQHQWPISEKLFTMDVIYLHDKPTPENSPQQVYDALVDAVEHVTAHEGYIFESGQGLARVIFRQMCTLLCHPQQRCIQDDLDIPRSLTRRVPPTDSAPPPEDNVPVSGQRDQAMR